MKKLTGHIINGSPSSENARHDRDFYPTPPECTHALLDFVKYLSLSTIWEPACGDGAISKVLTARGYSVISTDLRIDSGFGRGGIDFLQSEKLADNVITNPPFNLSEEFIEHCWILDFDFFALLLKSQYWHAKTRTQLFKTTKPAFVLPLSWRPNFAPARGKSPTIEMAWTVWIKGHNTNPVYLPLEKPELV